MILFTYLYISECRWTVGRQWITFVSLPEPGNGIFHVFYLLLEAFCVVYISICYFFIIESLGGSWEYWKLTCRDYGVDLFSQSD